MERVTELDSYDAVPRKGISWRAIFAGTLTVLSVLLVLNLIGMAIGLSAIEPTEEANPLSGLGTGTIIWWILSNLIALFAGGYVAARVGVSFTTKSGIIQGIMTWALFTIVSAWLLTSVIGSIISGVGNLVGSVLSTTGKVVGNTVGPAIQNQMQNMDVSWEQAKNEFESLLEDSNKQALDPDNLQSEANQITSQANAGADVDQVFNRARNTANQTFEALDKEALVNIIMERTNMTRAEAEQRVDRVISQYEEARTRVNQFLQNAGETAKKQAGNVANAVAKASLYLSISLILGIIAAGLGGLTGVKSLRSDYKRKKYFSGDSRDRDVYREENG
jgi:hypothetical protein